jgi:hypothetical protein
MDLLMRSDNRFRSHKPAGAARGLLFLVSVVFLGSLAATVAGCFSPRNTPCAFTCVSTGNLCPDGFTCGTDGLCHRDGAEDVCSLTSPYDAGADATELGTD